MYCVTTFNDLNKDESNYYNMCTPEHTHLHVAMHNRIVHTEHGFRSVLVAVADRWKLSDQSATMS